MWRFCVVALLAVQLEAQRAPESCERYAAAARADSSSAQALYRLGRCAYRDYEMVAPNGDSTQLAFRSSWTTALRALRRAVTLDPAFAPAYRPLFAILFADTRDGCSSVTGLCSHVAPNVRVGDTLVTVPRLVSQRSYGAVLREAAASKRANLLEAREVAARWTVVAPNDAAPHAELGRALLRLGDAMPAADELERAAALGTPATRREIFFDRFEALVKSNRGADARQAIDEAASNPGRDTLHLLWKLVPLDMLVGRVRTVAARAMDTVRARVMHARIDSLMRQPRPPHLATPQEQFQVALAGGDTAAARRALVRYDSSITPPPNSFSSGFSEDLFRSARMHVATADTTGAEAQLGELEQHLMRAPFQYNPFLGAESLGPWLGQAWLLTGDIAAARGRRADAETMYRRLIGLWQGGDVALQPLVRDARTRLAAFR
jgi:tetratricopeptide (TPR) repeat protein